ncbi:heterogeneous nuclear ribonucleoprotein A0 [Trifolium repens]|nr:heterogeneous nuclear ribonucleoprotein A0 [Trifolium repens]
MRGRERERGGGSRAHLGRPRRQSRSVERDFWGGRAFGRVPHTGRDDEEWTEVRRRGRKKHRQVDDGTDLARQNYRKREDDSPLSSRFASSVARHRNNFSVFQRCQGTRHRSHPYSLDHRSVEGDHHTMRFKHADKQVTRAGTYVGDRLVRPRTREGRWLSPGHQRRRYNNMSVQQPAVLEKEAYPSYGFRRNDQNEVQNKNTSSGVKWYVSFYFTNFLVLLSNFYLRKGFEVCGILEDVYVARKRNKRGQPYGFVRFSNVRDITKLTKALNAVSFGDFRIRARVARFDRFDEPFDESARVGVEKFKGDVLVAAKPKEQIAIDGNGKPRVDEQPQNDTFVPLSQEGVTVGSVLLRLGDGNGKSRAGAQKQGKVQQVEAAIDEEKDSRIFLCSYRAASDDVLWAQRGVVATVANGEAGSVVRRRVQDAGFKELDLLHLGGDIVLVRSLEEADVLSVLDQAKDFFRLCFSDWVRWEKAVIPFQRGAWVRIYGIPLHAWNVNFFKLCVMDCGRFLRPDSYTVARDRLDYARVLISTTTLAVVKKVEQLLVDGSLVEVQIIEEWGFDLGDDACLLEDDAASKASIDVDDESRGDPEASNQVDMLVDQLAKEVADANCHGSQHQGVPRSLLIIIGCPPVECVAETEMTTQNHSTRESVGVRIPPTTVKADMRPEQHKRMLSCPPASRSRLSGPWSLEWLQDHNIGGAGVIFSARKRPKKGGGKDVVHHKRESGEPNKKKVGGFLRHSLYSLKRIARLPIDDRREVLHILQKNARRRRPRGVASRPSMSVSRASADGVTSSSSVNNDWKHWMAMQGDASVVEEDVLEVGKAVGATFKGNTANKFSVLSKAGTGKRVGLGGALD